jgi:hypothetical protein
LGIDAIGRFSKPHCQSGGGVFVFGQTPRRHNQNHAMNDNRIIIFDTTLRDGEQCPGASMNGREKLEVARQF